MQQYSAENKSYRFILVTIDCFTKRLRAEPLKTKKGEEVAAVASKIFTQNSAYLLHVDQGREFYNKHFEALVKNII